MTNHSFSPRGRKGRFSDHRPKESAGRPSSGGKMPVGKYDRLQLSTEEALWIHVSPFQEYTYSMWDADSGSVQEQTTPWYGFRSHFIPGGGRSRRGASFVCSAGAHLDKPCWAHAVNAYTIDTLRKEAQESGEEYTYNYMDAPFSSGGRFALSVTIMEDIYTIPARDGNGNARTSKNNRKIFNHIPGPFVGAKDAEGAPMDFGRNVHWSMSKTNLAQLLDIDDEVREVCKQCTGELRAKTYACPECLIDQQPLKADVGGYDLANMRSKAFPCGNCGDTDADKIMETYCPDCGVTGADCEGSLTDFDIRVKLVSSGGKGKDLKLVGVRPTSQDEKVRTLVENPLDLVKIFAPDNLDYQKSLIPDFHTDNLNPKYGVRDDSGSDHEVDSSNIYG